MKWKEWSSARELKTVAFWRDVFSEFLTTGCLLLYVVFSMVTLNKSLYTANMTYIGLMVGFMIFVLIEGHGPISAFMNPCASLAHCLAGRISLMRALIYTISESAGAVAGSYLVYQLTPVNLRDEIHAFVPNEKITPLQGMIVEMILTFNLVFVGLTASDRRTHDVILPSLPIAFTVAVGIMAAGTWTGACQNPLVALGPAVVSGNFSHHWIYWAGSYSAAIIAAAYHIACYKTRNTPKQTLENDKKPTDVIKVENKVEVYSF